MSFLADTVLDNGLQKLTDDVNRIDICSQEPTTYAEATSTYTLGNKTSPTVSAPKDATTNGRRVEISSFSDGSVTGTGDVTHYALVDTAGSVLLGTEAVASAPVSVSSGNNWSFDAFDVRIPDA